MVFYLLLQPNFCKNFRHFDSHLKMVYFLITKT